MMKLNFNFDKMQQLGRALMLPIAILPIAGILLRLGQADLLNIKFIADSGNIIFTQLPLLFALGVAVGLAKDNNGTAALASCVGYFIMTSILTDISKDSNTGVLGGILIGVVTAYLYNRFKDIKLPEYLAFFGGKRFVPIITGLVAVLIGTILGYIWPPIQHGIGVFGDWLLHSGAFGTIIYGVMNRILLLAGLHHVLNNLVWFVFGNYTNASGIVVHGDIARFMAGDPTAGTFMSGYFPIMMFGLPAACLAMYKNAYQENKKAVAGMLLSMALTSFLTGVTEPVEFSFVFLAPILFVIHAFMLGISLTIMNILNVHMGFTFSAGAIDYLLFFKLSTNPLYLLPIGIAVGLIYYFVFDLFIRKFNLQIIGRDINNNISIIKADSRALQFIEALGGFANLITVDACTTRLRLSVKNSDNVNKTILKQLGAKGIIAPSDTTLQVIVGTTADIIASEIQEAIKNNNQVNNHDKTPDHSLLQNNINNNLQDNNLLAKLIIKNLGNKNNINSINLVALTRLRCEIKDINLINQEFFINNNDMQLININDTVKQVYIGSNVAQIYEILKTLMIK